MDIASPIFLRGTDSVESGPFYRPPAFEASSTNNLTPVHFCSQPPEDDQPKCSLPSISAFFDGADSATVQQTGMSTNPQIACIGSPKVANTLCQSIRESAL